MKGLEDETVDLLLTSPPYPMIEMWDDIFASQDPRIEEALENGEGDAAFELMHGVLDPVWAETWRVMKKGAIACVNIGDATRSVGGRFSLFANHSRIQHRMRQLGFSSLPAILWRKQTNAPNKFMGSGMLPPGAYVTLEHEYILVFRKGDKKIFSTEDQKRMRRESAYFWEERNLWFSDVWFDLKGAGQEMADSRTRARSGAFPFELAYRIVNMFSVKNDLVLDPFMGTGTAMCAAAASGRNSVGYEIDPGFETTVSARAKDIVAMAEDRERRRLAGHVEFVREKLDRKGAFKHRNRHYGFPVTTAQEKELLLSPPESVERTGEGGYRAVHRQGPSEPFVLDWQDDCFKTTPVAGKNATKKKQRLDLFEALQTISKKGGKQ